MSTTHRNIAIPQCLSLSDIDNCSSITYALQQIRLFYLSDNEIIPCNTFLKRYHLIEEGS